MEGNKRVASEEEERQQKRVTMESEGQMSMVANDVSGGQVDSVLGYAEPKEDKLTLKALILGKDIGAIIGRGGSTIKLIRETCNCRVNISELVPGTSERILTATGAPSAVLNAYTQITHRLHEELGAASPESPKLSLNFLVASTQIGPIIGKGGGKIKELRESTGAHVSVAAEQLPGSTERTVTVSGPVDAVLAAIASLIDIINENPPKGNFVAFRPQARLEQLHAAAILGNSQQQLPMGYGQYGGPTSYGGNLGMGAGLGSRGGRSAGEGPGPGEATQIVSIPNEYIGAIIGKGGSKIHEIRSLSTTHIKITDPVPGAVDRQVILTGTPEANQTACYMLTSRLQQEMARRQALM